MKSPSHKTDPIPVGDDMSEYEALRMQVVSGTECTGMMPAPPQDEPQAAAYRDLSGQPVQENTRVPRR